jgi:hypothetical protein
MKNIFLFLLVIFLFAVNVNADENNPTNEWLKDKTVNDLTQEYGYRLFSVTEDGSTALFTLTKGKIVVGCLSAPGNPNIKFYCYLP